VTSLNRALGLARSLLIYHGIPLRQRRMRRLYSAFVRPGDLVFDIGAHAGNRTRALSSLGCRVVALEPQPDFARLLQLVYRHSSRVTVVPAAVGAVAGRATLAISDRTPTVTTMSEPWRASRSAEPDFKAVRWDRRLDVDVMTLDALIARYGAPRFVKIDVEGAEADVVAGLSRAVPVLSFEYLPRALDGVQAVLEQLGRLGPYRFNWSPGESYRLASEQWIDRAALLASLDRPAAQQRSGDVYAALGDI
jgi:FkbM family methyltransferase